MQLAQRCQAWIRPLLPALLALGLVQCGSEEPTSPGPGTPPSAPAVVGVAFRSQPATTAAGDTLGAIRVALVDTSGATVVRDSVTITLALLGTGDSGAATLSGTLSRLTANGVATFDDLWVDRVGGAFKLRATAPSVPEAQTATFTIVPGPVTTMTFTAQPDSGSAGAILVPAAAVLLRDAHGNVATNATTSVVLRISPGTGTAGAALRGTLTRQPVDGVVRFDDLVVDRGGAGFTFTASSPGLTDAVSGPFQVTPWAGGPVAITLTSDPGDYVGQGLSYSYSKADAVISTTANGAQFTLSIQGDQNWSATFQGPDTLMRLEPGLYDNLQRFPFHNPAAGGLTWFGEGRGCNTLTGWFAVDSAVYAGLTLQMIHLRFEQHCEGNSPALRGTIHWDAGDPTQPPPPVWPVPGNLWTPAAGATPDSGSFVYLVSDAGDYIGQGQTLTYLADTTALTISQANGLLTVQVDGWNAQFKAMVGFNSLQAGWYPDLRRYPFHNPAKGGLNWSGQGRGCNRLTGWFAVDEISYTGATLTSVTLRFEQHCEGATPALRGMVRLVP